MSLDTYANLKLAIDDWLDRDFSDSQIDDFIDLAEERHRKDIRMQELLVTELLVVNNRKVAIPRRFLGAKTIRLLTDPVTALQPCNIEKMNRVRRETLGRPKWFTIHEVIEFDRLPEQSYSSEIIFWQEVYPLSTTVTTNTILQKAPGCYLYGALAAAAPFLMHDERIQTWEGLYRRSRDDANGLSTSRTQVGAPIARVPGRLV